MEYKSSRKFNSEFRKNLKHKISKLSDKNDFIFIYKIINIELNKKISVNRNGIYFNLNLLSDDSIEEISDFINNKIDSTSSEQYKLSSEKNKITYEIYNKDNVIENFIQNNKLSNQEKSLIKKYYSK
jgi:hypothetical protein